MWSSPRINLRVDLLPTKTEVLLGKLFFSILASTFWAEIEKNYVSTVQIRYHESDN
jgi:hypothetical protein